METEERKRDRAVGVVKKSKSLPFDCMKNLQLFGMI
jgi:hypothetical protein